MDACSFVCWVKNQFQVPVSSRMWTTRNVTKKLRFYDFVLINEKNLTDDVNTQKKTFCSDCFSKVHD